MANPLDELTDPINEAGREVRVIEKQLPVEIGVGSAIFEVIIYISGFLIAAVIQFLVVPQWVAIGYVLLWIGAFLPMGIYAIMKIQAKNYFMQLLQRIQASASTIGNYQEQRFEILKNVAGLLKQSIQLDKEVMTAVSAYRGGISPEGKTLNENAAVLDRGFGSLVPQIEAYPELKSHAQIAEAMRQNSYLQREITAARDLYNQMILIWNTELYNWPVKQIVAARQHFTTKIPFSVSKTVIEGSKSTFF